MIPPVVDILAAAKSARSLPLASTVPGIPGKKTLNYMPLAICRWEQEMRWITTTPDLLTRTTQKTLVGRDTGNR